MNGLYLVQESERLNSLFARSGQVAFTQLSAWAEIPPLPAWAIFLSVVVLLVTGLWLYYLCMQMGVGATLLHRQRMRQAAEQRAERLLRENVSDNQYQQMLTNGYLDIPSRLYPGRTYRIPHRPGRVWVYEADRQVCQLCVISCTPVPHADLILAQKWMIEADERVYLAIANRIENPPSRSVVGGLETRM